MSIAQRSRGSKLPVDEVTEQVLAKLATSRDRQRARRALRDVFEGREHQEYAELKLRRGIFALHDAGVPQREIAKAVGISQPEVSRRLKRRPLRSQAAGPRDVILQRRVGAIDTEEMLRRLTAMRLTVRAPGKRGAVDGAASVTGTAKQLVAALREGMITEAEYEAIRRVMARKSA